MSLIQKYQAILPEVSKYGATLIAVSKKKPAADIKTLYDVGHRDFGENYIQELQDKMQVLPKDINWHFIGHLQSNKCKVVSALVKEGYTLCIQTIDSIKLAKKLNSSIDGKLHVFIQVNISEEATKSGILLKDCQKTVKTIKEECLQLNLIGLMCIGSSHHSRPNPEFLRMKSLVTELNQTFNLDLKLSMGMSDDYLHALELGSNLVRIGSSIFGQRENQ